MNYAETRLTSPVSPETWRALLAVAADFAALKPWEFTFDSEVVGLIDSVTGEMRIGNVLGNAGEVFAAVIYRRAGLRWILSLLADAPDSEDLNNADGMDCLKMEFVANRELWKEDLAVVKIATFKPAGRGCVWPQFRSCTPGWHPWHIHQNEADQLLSDLPRLAAFYKLFEQCPELYDGHDAAEIPFVPVSLPDRPLTPVDLDWRPVLSPPLTGFEPFSASGDQLEKLHAIKLKPGLTCEFDCTLVPSGSFYENGRPCFGRLSLLVEKQRGLVLGMEVAGGALTPGEAAGRGLVKTMLMAKSLPGKIFVAGSRLQQVLQPLCDELKIELWPVSSLSVLEEAVQQLTQHLLAAGGPGADEFRP